MKWLAIALILLQCDRAFCQIVISPKYKNTPKKFSSIGIRVFKNYGGDNIKFQKKLELKVYKELKKITTLNDVRFFPLIKDSLNKVVALKFKRKQKFRSFVPSSAGQTIDNYTPDILLLLKRSNISKNDKTRKIVHTHQFGKFTQPFYETEHKSGKASVKIRFLIWDNNKCQEVGYGELKERKIKMSNHISSSDLEKLTQEMAESIVSKIRSILAEKK